MVSMPDTAIFTIEVIICFIDADDTTYTFILPFSKTPSGKNIHENNCILIHRRRRITWLSVRPA